MSYHMNNKVDFRVVKFLGFVMLSLFIFVGILFNSLMYIYYKSIQTNPLRIPIKDW